MSGEEQRETELKRHDVLADLQAEFREEVTEAHSPRPGRIWATVDKEALRRVAKFLLGYEWSYLSTISSVDTGEEFWLIYHFWVAGNATNIRVKVDRLRPEIPSIMDITPSANYYEREVHDLMGIKATGRGELKKLVISDDWPEGNYPLRKDWKGLPGGEQSG